MRTFNCPRSKELTKKKRRKKKFPLEKGEGVCWLFRFVSQWKQKQLIFFYTVRSKGQRRMETQVLAKLFIFHGATEGKKEKIKNKRR